VAIRHRFPASARGLNNLVSLGAVAGGQTTIWSNLGALSPQLLNSTQMATPAAV